MSSELLYTSAPKGLRHGSRGFCSVLTTAGMPINVVSRLESLSGYRHLFNPGGPEAGKNPISFAHQRLNIGGEVVSVLSRVASYGTDYSGRSNKLAHHVMLSPAETPAAGPAWLLQQPTLMRSEWLGQCETPAQGPAIPKGDQNPRICTSWKNVFNDAGWGGVVAEEIAAGGDEPLWIIYALEQADRLLEMIDESISLLPPQQRWQATFNTYAANIAPDVRCKVRFVPVGTEEAKFALSSGKVIDLTKSQSITAASKWVEQARGVLRADATPVVGGGGFNAVQERAESSASQWSSLQPAGPPPPEEPPSLPPEIATAGKNHSLFIAVAVLAVVLGLTGTWIFARNMAGLPIIPGGEIAAEPAPAPFVPPEPEPEPEEPTPVVEVEPFVLAMRYDQKQLLEWATSGDVDERSPMPGPIRLRGRLRLPDTTLVSATDEESQTSTGNKPSDPGEMIKWGGELRSLAPASDLTIESTQLTSNSGVFRVHPIPYTPAPFAQSIQTYWSTSTDDLVAIAELDWQNPPDEFASQAEAYRAAGASIASVIRLFESLKENSQGLPKLLQGHTSPLLTASTRDKVALARYLIRNSSNLQSMADEATEASERLVEKAKNSPKRLKKEEQAGLVAVVKDCERIASTVHELEDSFAVLETGHVVDVPELVFHDAEGAVTRRIPLRFHFFW